MITFIKKLFGLDAPAVAEAKPEAPYKVETPAPKAVAIEHVEIVPVGHADIPVTIAKPEPAAKPEVKAAPKPKAPANPKAEKKPAEPKPKAPAKPRAKKAPAAK